MLSLFSSMVAVPFSRLVFAFASTVLMISFSYFSARALRVLPSSAFF